jgi:hypothetical protein
MRSLRLLLTKSMRNRFTVLVFVLVSLTGCRTGGAARPPTVSFPEVGMQIPQSRVAASPNARVCQSAQSAQSAKFELRWIRALRTGLVANHKHAQPAPWFMGPEFETPCKHGRHTQAAFTRLQPA